MLVNVKPGARVELVLLGGSEEKIATSSTLDAVGELIVGAPVPLRSVVWFDIDNDGESVELEAAGAGNSYGIEGHPVLAKHVKPVGH